MGTETRNPMSPFKWTNDACKGGRTWRLSLRATGQIVGRVLTEPLDDGSIAFTALVFKDGWKPLGSYLTWQQAKKTIQNAISGRLDSPGTSGS